MQPLTFDEFTGLKVAGLDAYDYLALSYCAGRGLPGLDKSNLEAWYSKRDAWVSRIQFETARHFYRFDPNGDAPTELTHGNSLPRFLCSFMLQVLQEDCEVKYNPERKFQPAACKPADVFAHGIMDDDGEGGTCASMPVVYVSVGRRLGYPLFLVETRGHLFCRWDDTKGTTIRWQFPDLMLQLPPERFNVEGTGHGISFYDDDYYREFPEKWTEADIQHGWYLRSFTASQAMAGFLIERGECFWDFGMREHALQSYHFARQLEPDDVRYQQLEAARFEQYALERFAMEEDRKMQKLRLAQSNPYGHAPTCLCPQCVNVGHLRSGQHGSDPSCQCLTCQRGRMSQRPAGMPGHQQNCPCLACKNVRGSRINDPWSFQF